jgi:hypothetical protein
MKSNNIFFSILFLFCMIFDGALAYADTPSDSAICTNEQQAMTATEQKYKAAFADDQQQSDDMKKDSVTLGGDITWSDQTIIFDVPTVTMRDQKLIFGVPQVTMKSQHIIFDTPSVKMVPIKTGQYPETTCTDTWIDLPFGGKTKGIPACTVSWHDIINNVPQPFMQHQDILMGVPEFTWADTQVIMGIPEFSMSRIKWIIGLPQFTVRSIAINSQKIQDKSNGIQQDVAAKKTAMTKDLTGEIHALFECHRSSLVSQRTAAANQFDTALAQFDANIQSMKNSGIDPSVVKDSAGRPISASRADLLAQRDKALSSFDAAIKGLNDSEQSAISKLTSS